MRSVLVVASREMAERKSLAGAAVAFGLLILAARHLPFIPHAPDVASTLAIVLQLSLPLAFALGLGATVVAGDLSQRRMGFYFARPLGGLSIWAGKMLAAVAFALFANFCIALPTVVGERGVRWYLDGPGLPLLIIILLAVAAAHAASVAYGARDGLLALDLVALVLTLAALVYTGYRLLAETWGGIGAIERALFSPVIELFELTALVALGLLTLAGAVGSVVGRSDIRRAHVALSLTLWGGAFAFVLALGGYVSWMLGGTPASLGIAPFGLQAAPRGPYALVICQRAGHPSRFLLNTENGEHARLGVGPAGLSFSVDGRRAVWVSAGFGADSTLVTADLGEKIGAKTTALDRARFPGGPYELTALSADASRAVLSSEARTFVVDVASTRPLASAPAARRAWFVDDRRVRLDRAGSRGDGLELTDLDLRTGIEEPVTAYPRAVLLGVSGERFLVRTPKGGLHLWDGRSDATVVDDAPGRQVLEARFGPDGAIVAFVRDVSQFRLLYQVDGGPARTLDLPVSWGRPLGEVRPGLLAVAAFNQPGTEPSVLFVDLAKMERVRPEVALEPVEPFFSWGTPSEQLPVPGSRGARLFLKGGRLVEFDPDTGAARALLESSKP